VLVLLSQLKYHVLMMTANFVDVMIVDTDTLSLLERGEATEAEDEERRGDPPMIFPTLRWIVALSLVALHAERIEPPGDHDERQSDATVRSVLRR
jgi:hypothetical protein